MMFLSCMFAYGVLFKELESESGWSRAAIAGASSLMMLMMGTLGIFLGRVNDVAGPRLLLTLTGGALRRGLHAHVPDEQPLGAIPVFWGEGGAWAGLSHKREPTRGPMAVHHRRRTHKTDLVVT